MKILAVIPARSGSKGIRKKNIKLLNNKPLISYIINTAMKSKYITDIVVTSDSDEILNVVKNYGVKIRKRPYYLAEDHVPLDPVIYDAYQWHKNNFFDVDYVITLQPTSPLLSQNTLDKAIEYTINNNFDTVLSIVDNTHLGWKEENNKIIPDYTKRLNRQWLPKRYKETGAFFISKKEFISENNRFGKNISVYEVPAEEAIDIDTPLDWYLSEKLLQRLKILFVTSGNSKMGMGHIYRTITLADSLIGNQIGIFLLDSSNYAKEIIENSGYKYKDGTVDDVYEIAKDFDIIINDFLDTTNEYMNKLKKLNRFIINFEDLSISSDKANLVFNALYERFNVPKNHRYGYKYSVLKESFLIETPNSFKNKVENLLITFGGVDLNNLTLKTIKSIKNIVLKKRLQVKIILGPGYNKLESLLSTIEKFELRNHVKILHNISNMAKEMKEIDLAITSNGRTVYELASMRIPIISIAQNDRETLHTFARYNEGVEYLGIACNVKEEDINKVVLDLINNKEKRFYMYKNLPYNELRNGTIRVKEEIIDNYWRWKNGKNW
ncbi:CMP-N-acetylneuraminic acid synthetase [Marinitoga hydrogenitolerans DSM 16785]|uniref:CMP-N-acetylneuraminic acid synthetase n=1 Tax=Marinitoga hydrogenitolerans (strain DSM 16785 / JCM 12826 / AT1271) TaxID=1122195 RepID=A0A1M4Y3D9_MARH1|nr:glycosyltransferase [Marinitoga hydrogenitolerans]SHF00334.1 CMP-N-acetylneuraminic acid synthetase [Marinitoga hydrogenitolerans DSM 16785]